MSETAKGAGDSAQPETVASEVPGAGAADDQGSPADDGNEANAQLLELQDAFVQALSACGALGKLRAQLRAVAVGLLRADPAMQTAAVGRAHSLHDMPLVTQVSLILVEDLLNQLELSESAGVFAAEAGSTFASDEAYTVVQEQLRGRLGSTQETGKGSLLEALVAAAMEQQSSHQETGPAPKEGRPATGREEPAPKADSDAEKTQTNVATASSTTDALHKADGASSTPSNVMTPIDTAVADAEDDVVVDLGVKRFVEQHEESIEYNDAEGPLPEDEYDEVEVL